MPFTPISTAAPLYPSGASYYPVSSARTTLTGPYPTNAWFMNWLLETGQQPINVFPYELKQTTTGLDVCFPSLSTTNPNAVLATFLGNFSLRAVQPTLTQKLTAFTTLGCTLTWTAASGSMSSPVVRGAAYVTMNYTTMTPLLVSIHAILTVNGTAVGATGTFTGTKFKVTMNNGQTWLIYSSSSLTLNLSTANTFTATAAFTGSIRLAILPSAGDEAALDASAPAIHTGGSVDFTLSGNTATQTYSFTQTGSGTLLTYALPHHIPWLTSPSPGSISLSTLRGTMRSVLGNLWVLSIPLPAVGWNNASPFNSSRVAAIQAALNTDRTFVPAVSDPYFGGKQLAKAARLALIADQLGDTASRDLLLANLKSVINNYLTGVLGTKLRYDTVWGGIVSVAGLTNQDADFGNGRYNDHHFHYGYPIFAAAVIARYDPTWAAANQTRINDLVRDIANPSASDPYFTTWRNFDFYEGHSWAAGNFEFGDNRNQESTSEAVNAWYGLYLWGLASGQTQLANMGRVLFAQEVVAAQTYWQMKPADTIYPTAFEAHGAVGILWSNKVDYATFFGAQDEYIHGIQLLPITPATEVLAPAAWINYVWPTVWQPLWTRTSVWRAEVVSGGSGYVGANVSPTGQQYTDGLTASGGSGSGLVFNVNITAGRIEAVFIVFNQHGTGYVDGETITLNGSGGTGATVKVYTTPEDGWKAVLLGAYAQVNPNTAWTMTQALTGFDDGSSRTQALAHIASQTGSGPVGPQALPISASAASTSSASVTVRQQHVMRLNPATSTSSTTATANLSGTPQALSISASARSTSSATVTVKMDLRARLNPALSISTALVTGTIPPEPPAPPPPPAPKPPRKPGHKQRWEPVVRGVPMQFVLTQDEIAEIRARFLNGEDPRLLAEEYGVMQSAMEDTILALQPKRPYNKT